MKYDKNPRYFLISVYAFFVLAAAILFYLLMENIRSVKEVCDQTLSLLTPFFGAFGIAFS